MKEVLKKSENLSNFVRADLQAKHLASRSIVGAVPKTPAIMVNHFKNSISDCLSSISCINSEINDLKSHFVNIPSEKPPITSKPSLEDWAKDLASTIKNFRSVSHVTGNGS